MKLRRKYVNDVRGYNSRLDPLQAAVLGVKLAKLDQWNGRRAAIAARYEEALGSTGLVLPSVPNWANPAWHLYVVQSPARDRLQERLAELGIDTLIHYPIPPHRQRAYADLDFATLPIAERLADEVISLPIGPHLPGDDVESVIEALRAAVG